MNGNRKLMWIGIPMAVMLLGLTYVIARVFIIPVTCDEVQTCMVFSQFSVLEIVTYSRAQIPNNHIFHTLLVKLSVWLFGMKDWSVRIPNLLGYIMYCYFAYRLMVRQTKYWWELYFGLIVLIGNAYLLDFFSLARGYGLASSFMLGSICLALEFIQNKRIASLRFAMLLGVLSVYSNFTTLNFYVALCLLLFANSVINDWSNRKQVVQVFLNLILPSLLLAALSYLPILRMRETNQFVYWGSTGFYADTYRTLSSCLVYGASYFGENTSSQVRFGMSLLLVVMGVSLIVGRCYNATPHTLHSQPAQVVEMSTLRPNTTSAGRTMIFCYLLLLTAVLVNIIQHIVTKTPYLQTRTALFYYPLFALTVVQFAPWLHHHCSIGSAKYYVAILGLMWVIHLGKTVNLYSCNEWWYDSDTKTIIKYLSDQHDLHPEKGPVRLATFSWMQPSFWFHIVNDKHEDKVRVPAFIGEVHPNEDVDYYFTEDRELDALKEKFEIVQRFPASRVLLKRKN
jgi:hypothetical protein